MRYRLYRLPNVLHDRVNIDIDRRDLAEYSRGDARFVCHMVNRNFGLLAVYADPANNHFFHTARLFFHL